MKYCVNATHHYRNLKKFLVSDCGFSFCATDRFGARICLFPLLLFLVCHLKPRMMRKHIPNGKLNFSSFVRPQFHHIKVSITVLRSCLIIIFNLFYQESNTFGTVILKYFRANSTPKKTSQKHSQKAFQGETFELK